jgi:putative peptide zinc metalloprotease protein
VLFSVVSAELPQRRTAGAAADPAGMVPPPLRRELVATPQSYLGRRYIVYKNPLSLAFYRLPAAHAEAAELFDGRRTLADIQRVVSADSRYWRALERGAALTELGALASQMVRAGLLQVPGSTATERDRQLREMKQRRRWEAGVAQTLFFRKSLFDPDRLLNLLLARLGWIFRPRVLLVGACYVVAAFIAALWNTDRLVEQGANFFTLANLGLTWVIFIFVKILHEFGHGLTAKYHRAEVHEMGFLFILFTPYLFCNVSDSWRSGKTARVSVGSAGIIVELFIAATAAWLWMGTQPGLFNQICFNTMVLCSISTILFNGNPLMKFDGYYVLADLLDTPNLRAKSNAWVTNWAQRRLLGLEVPPPPAAPGETGWFFGIYAVLAYCYSWFIIFAISAMLFNLLEPYGLQFISRAYVLLFLGVSLFLPFIRLVRSVGGDPMMRKSASRRLAGLAMLGAVSAAALFFVPWTDEIKRSAILEHARVETVSAAVGGFLTEVEVEEGQAVIAGQLLGRLHNIDLEARVDSLQFELEAWRVRLREVTALPGVEARLSAPVMARQIAELEAELLGLEVQRDSLELRAGRAGVVRTAHPARLRGRQFAARQPVFEIGCGERLRVLVALDEKEVRRVRVGQPVAIVFEGLPGTTFRGQVVAVPVSPSPRFAGFAMANLLGGDVPADLQPASGAVVPSLPHFEIEADLGSPTGDLPNLRAQSAGRARITAREMSLARWLHERVLELVHPDIRL